MILASSVLSVSWEFIKRHPGIVLVLIGVAGEVICDWKEMVGRLAWAKRLSAILLIVGLAIEFGEAAKSDNELANTNLRTHLIESNNVALQVTVEELRSKNIALESKLIELKGTLQPRRITTQQRDRFIELLKTIPKFPVKVFVGREDSETHNYALQIREMLNSAGFGTGEDDKVRKWGDAELVLPIGNEVGMDSPLVMVLFGEYGKPVEWPGLKVTFDKGQSIYTFTNDVSGFGTIASALNQIGIFAATVSETNWFLRKPGEWAIFVHVKF
jgi:hypothetical protein